MGWQHTPLDHTRDLQQLATYVEQEFSRLSVALEFAEDVQLVESHVEPTRPRNGLIVLADGTNWDPGSGAGYYGYHNAAWVFLG